MLFIAGKRGSEVNLVNPKDINHRGRGRWRVCSGKCRNLGSPCVSLLLGGVSGVQVWSTQGFGNEHLGGGAGCSSDEASNDRGAKSWQVVRAQEGNKCPYTA